MPGRHPSRASSSELARCCSAAVCESLEQRRLLTGTWAALTRAVPNNPLGNADGAQMMLLLSDGSLMVHGNVFTEPGTGGVPTSFSNVSSKSWYKLTPRGNDYVNGDWTTLAPMQVARKFAPTVVLPSGKVVIVGGEYSQDNNNPPNDIQPFLTSGELYDPLTDTWSNISDFNTTGNSRFGDDPIEMLPNGTLLAGYLSGPQTYLYNPSNNTWTATGTKLHNDASDEESWVTLPDGSILSYDVFASKAGTFRAQRYIPATGQWIDASNVNPSNPPSILSDPNPPGASVGREGDELGPALLLPDGRVWFAGANGNTAFYSPASNQWSAGFNIPGGNVATDNPAAMLPNGHVLIAVSPLGTLNAAGTAYNFPNGVTVYEFDPLAQTAATAYTNVTPSLPAFNLTGVNAYQTTMLVLPNGHVAMCNESGTIAEFTPTSPGLQDAWRPYVTNVTSVGFNIFHVTGVQLTGISEGAAYGDDNEMSSNYPIVQLIDKTGALRYARTFNWSIGVAQGNTPQSFDFSLPVNWDPDAYLMTVVANGIPSGQILNVQMGAATTTSMTLQPHILAPQLLDVLANGSVESTWALSSIASVIVSGNNAAELMVLSDNNFGGRYCTLNGSGGNDIIRLESSSSPVVVNGDDGSDFTDFSFGSHNLSNVTGATTVNGGSGDDSIFVYDNANANAAASYSINSNGMSRAGWGGFLYGAAVEHATLTTGTGNNPVAITSTNAGQSLLLNSAGGADAVNIGGTGTAQSILGSIEIHNSPNFTALTVDDTNDFGRRNVVIDNSGSFGVLTGITGPLGGAISWANNDLGSLTLITSQFGDGTIAVRAMSKPLTIHGYGGAYAVTLGGSANGMQSLVGDVTLIAAFGKNQSLTLDDAADTGGRNTVITRSDLNGDYFVSGLAFPGEVITFRDFGSLAIQQGSGADSLAMGGGTMGNYLPVTVNGNGGNDAFNLTAFNNWQDGLGGTFVFPIMFDGGTGFNSLSLLDTARTSATYQLYPARFYSREPSGFGQGSDFNYDNMNAIGLTCSNAANAIAVYGVSSDIPAGNQVTIVLNGGNDVATVFPRDAAGNLTINANLGIVGGAGTDSFTIDGSLSNAATTYSFSNPFGASTQDVFFGAAAGVGYTNDFETAAVKGGGGNDTFAVNQYTSNVPLTLSAGAGDDVLNLGNDNLVGGIIMPSGSFLFDGQDGFDRFNLNNRVDISQWTYTYGGNIQATRGAPVFGYDTLFQTARSEELTVNAGPGADTFLVPGVPSGRHAIFNGRGNVDVLQTGLIGAGVQTLIQGKVTFDAGSVSEFGTLGGGNVIVSAAAHTTPIIAHLTANTIGAVNNDSLFAPGGSVEFFNATSVNLTLGGGADTLFATPNLTAPVTLAGGNPTAAPGDTLNLALAGAQNYALHGTAASGNVTSSNLKTISYSGFENGAAVDDIAPAVANADINLNGIGLGPVARIKLPARQQALDVQFSEDVGLLSASSLQLTNLTTGQPVPEANIAVSFDVATEIAHFTFPGYPNGILPDGNYHGVVMAVQTTDAFGNSLAGDVPFDFFFLNGDTNHDRVVDVSDLGVLATNWQASGKLFSEGDFNYDGQVDVADLGILATNWQQTLPLPAASGARPPKIRRMMPFATALSLVGLTRATSGAKVISSAISEAVELD